MTLCKKFKTHKLPLSPVFQGFAGVFFSLTVKNGIFANKKRRTNIVLNL